MSGRGENISSNGRAVLSNIGEGSVTGDVSPILCVNIDDNNQLHSGFGNNVMSERPHDTQIKHSSVNDMNEFTDASHDLDDAVSLSDVNAI
jgi:hypothetical protein